MTSISTEVTPYSRAHGVVTKWHDGTELRIELANSPEPMAIIAGNADGLRSLARHLLTLAQDDVPLGSHLDFDTYCGWLADGSAGLRIERE